MNIVYVLDVSASMERSQKMKRAQEALNEALDELSPEDTFTLVTFGNHAKALSRPLKATRANLSVGHANVNAAIPEPGSNTNMEAGLEMALRQPNVTHIFVLSDGEPTEGETDPERLLDLVRRKNRNSARIITFALIGSDNEEFGAEFLKRLAEEGEGIFRSVKLK
jgi:Ca-activated chloride channel family protein